MSRSVIAGLLLAAMAAAQTFEVASIKPNTSGGTGIHASSDGLQWRIQNASLKWLILRAWEIQDYQLSGPEWMEYGRFDLLAKMPEKTSRAGLAPMLRHLLEDRFGLTTHHVTKEMTGYILVVAKGGTTFHESPPGEGSDVHTSHGEIEAHGITMHELASEFGGELGRPVADETKLDRRYEIKLNWTPDDQVSGSGPDISIFTAVEEQLGLKLQSQKVPVDILVVDHVERTPTEN